VSVYLADRASKGFTVIQSIASWSPNAYGDDSFIAGDITQPNERYWDHVDYIVDQAAARGLYVTLLPCWGCVEESVAPMWSDASRLETYGRFLGGRYGDDNVIWLLGGESDPTQPEERRWASIARGIAQGAGGQDRVLMSSQPTGGNSSSRWLHDAAWLDYNTIQSGHVKDSENYELVTKDYQIRPVKPTIDGEPFYEDIPERFWDGLEGYRATDYDVRKNAYWAVFAGAFGHVYGANGVWQWLRPGETDLDISSVDFGGRHPWNEAMALPGSDDMQHVRRLVESRPYLIRIPDQSIVTSDVGSGGARVQATRGSDGSYAFVYIPDGRQVNVDLTFIAGETVRAWWYDPRLGSSTMIGEFAAADSRRFVCPSNGPANDWVLVLDDASRGFAPPGEVVPSPAPAP
jgi:uncharacterized protein DUF4038/collagenase-like protein with putative collagen-binding domain